MIRFDVNTSEISWYSNQLEKMHQSAFPNAVRGTLTELAKDVKSTTMPSTSGDFINRNKTFFKANSRYEPARGFNVNSMKSTVGMFANNNVKNPSAVEELEQQEHGGVIKNRELIPLKNARVTGNNNRSISAKNRLSQIKAKRIKQSTKETFIKDVHNAGKLGFIKTQKAILQVTSINKNRFKFKTLYKINKAGSVKINKATHFMQKASEQSALKANDLYIKEAQRQFERYYNS